MVKTSPAVNNLPLEDILGMMPGHVYWKNREGTFIGCNDQLAKTLGLASRHEIVGKTIYDFAVMTEAEHMTYTDQDVMNNDREYSAEVSYTLADGSQVIYLAKKVPLRNEKNEVIGVVAISFDITAQKKLQVLEGEKLIADEKIKILELFAASIAHELRTPLAAIKLGAAGVNIHLPAFIEDYRRLKEMHSDEDDKSEVRLSKLNQVLQVLENINKETDSANNIINMLLINIKSISSNIRTSEMENFKANDAIRKMIARYPFDREERTLITWNENESDDFSVQATQELIIYVLFNLMKNALYYIKAANKGQITIWLEKGNEMNFIHFKDTGTGIAPEILPHVFEQFFSKRMHGTGLGLAFCKMVLRNVNGDIVCRSVYGEFTEFILSFPRYFNLHTHDSTV